MIIEIIRDCDRINATVYMCVTEQSQDTNADMPIFINMSYYKIVNSHSTFSFLVCCTEIYEFKIVQTVAELFLGLIRF